MDTPKFRRHGRDPALGYTEEARRLMEDRPTGRLVRCLPAAEVRTNAVRELKEKGGDERSKLAVLGQYRVQFGQFRGQTFKWLLENALGYCAYIAAQVQQEPKSEAPLYANKLCLASYLKAFPEGKRAIELKSAARPKPTIPSRRPADVPSSRKRTAPATTPRAPKSPKTADQPEMADEDVSDADLLAAAEFLESISGAEAADTTSSQQSRADARSERGILLTEGWKKTLPEADKQWISQAFFRESSRGKAEMDMSKITQLWFYPPQAKFALGQPPKPSRYFASKILMWMPRKLWAVKLVCPREECDGAEMTSAGAYPTVRQVLDSDGYYNLAAEYLECRRCHRKLISWSKPILDQLDTGHRMQFPIVLSYKHACDMKIVTMLRDRSLGNGPFQMMRKVKEAHTTAWLGKTAIYQSAVKEFIAASEKGLIERPRCEAPPAMPSLPTYQWLLSIYCNDVLERIDEVKAGITSTFGRVLKVDSTKKIARKLAGHASGTAAWATNVGNEIGQVLMTVLTAAEGMGLDDMTAGLVRRYEAAGQPPPELLYVDRGCCGANSLVFKEWPDLTVRLDIWHFMRRLARGCTTESHQLYAFFLRHLSAAIFEWSADDVEQLVRAKRAELAEKNVICPNDDDTLKRIGRKEMARHCRRSTRGTDETTRLIEDLLMSLDGQEGRDTLGVPLFDSDKIWNIWESQKRHVACLQDPPGVQLYTKIGETVKGGVTLPVYRCARGSTSLESFHLHLNRFIPGTQANNVHYQAYLLEGVHRWNCDRAAAAVTAQGPSHTSYGSSIEHDVEKTNQELFGKAINPTLVAPRKYTGELIGLEYLFHQNNQVLLPLDPDEAEGDDEDLDAGFLAQEDLEDPTQPPPEVPARPASASQSNVASPSRRSRLGTDGSRAPATVARATVTRAPATVSRAPATVSRAPATVSRAPDSPPATVASRDLLAGDDDVEDTEDVPLTDEGDEQYTGPKNILGYDSVQALAEYLLRFREDNSIISQRQAEEIVQLWGQLSEYDKNIQRPPRYQEKLTKGRFKSSGASVMPGVESTRRCFLGSNTGPATWPDSNRVMECIITKLCNIFPHKQRKEGRWYLRWGLIIRAYKNIRSNVLNSAHITERTSLQLLDINQRTLIQWHDKRSKREERTVLEMGVSVPRPPLTTTRPLPAATDRPHTMPTPPTDQQFQFRTVPNTAGQATTRRKTTHQVNTAAPQVNPIIIQIQPTSAPSPIHPATPASQPRNMPCPPVFTARSTKSYWKQREEKEGKERKTYKPRTKPTICSQCKLVRDSEHHTQYYGKWYCGHTQQMSLDEWKELMAERRKAKKEEEEKEKSRKEEEEK
ncbi:uncharacterized protein [Diadema antillarum]|uniref:uncharacterized protein n=1 Tax=Diadema antillarum TaxID=105358 RepID=UPI003A8B4808